MVMFHTGLWERLDKLDCQMTARCANCRYDPETGKYAITFLNKDCFVNPQEKSIEKTGKDGKYSDADYTEQLCILAYLIHVRDLPVAGRLVAGDNLPGGAFFFRGLHRRPTDK